MFISVRASVARFPVHCVTQSCGCVSSVFVRPDAVFCGETGVCVCVCVCVCVLLDCSCNKRPRAGRGERGRKMRGECGIKGALRGGEPGCYHRAILCTPLISRLPSSLVSPSPSLYSSLRWPSCRGTLPSNHPDLMRPPPRVHVPTPSLNPTLPCFSLLSRTLFPT